MQKTGEQPWISSRFIRPVLEGMRVRVQGTWKEKYRPGDNIFHATVTYRMDREEYYDAGGSWYGVKADAGTPLGEATYANFVHWSYTRAWYPC